MTEKTKVILTGTTIFVTTVLCGWFGWYMGHTRPKPYQVVHTCWVASTYLKVKTLRHDSGWGKPWGSGNFNVKCERRHKGTEDCHCYRDTNGWEVCSTCDVYDDWCEWDYYAWPIMDTKEKRGDPDEKPDWILIPYEPPDQRVEMELEFEVLFKSEEGSNRPYLAPSLAELREYTVHEWWEVGINRVGKFVPIQLLTGESGG